MMPSFDRISYEQPIRNTSQDLIGLRQNFPALLLHNPVDIGKFLAYEPANLYKFNRPGEN